jgi:hypothetical protein
MQLGFPASPNIFVGFFPITQLIKSQRKELKKTLWLRLKKNGWRNARKLER